LVNAAKGPVPEHAAPGVTGRFRSFKERHHFLFEAAFFMAGFLFDTLLLHRIDSVPLLIHQGIYVCLSALLIGVDHRIHVAGKEPEGFWGKIASYRTWVIHFLLGTVLNAFVVFYFRATSVYSASSLFMALLLIVLFLNELPRFRARGPVVRVALLSFVITSYCAYLFPLIVGRLAWWLFLPAVLVGAAGTIGLWKAYARFSHDPNWTFRRAVLPGLIVQLALVLLYGARLLPPVPLSLRSIGIYHGVEKATGEVKGYKVKYIAQAAWKFWVDDAVEFPMREGDKAWAFVSVFAPRGFRDDIHFQWSYDDPKRGWVELGGPSVHPLGTGSENREQGYRTFANMTLKNPGTYRVVVSSSDGREIGRRTFDVVKDEGTAERAFHEDVL
jgi:hypothetical protein